jgi:four helix bundle protein
MPKLAEVFKEHTRHFSFEVVRLVESLPKGQTANVIGKQLLKVGIAIGPNYRSACRARNRKEFEAKLVLVEEGTDKCAFWIDLLVGIGLVKRETADPLLKEGQEILSVVGASIRKLRRRTKKKKVAVRRSRRVDPKAD